METNANNKLLATLLKKAHAGFTGLIATKKGKVRGGKVYGDDKVHVVILSGFKYPGLVERSLEAVCGIQTQDVIDAAARRGHQLDAADVGAARTELLASFERSLAGDNKATTDHVYNPLTVDDDGQTVNVRGSRVYKCVAGEMDDEGKPRTCHCRNCTGDPRAPLPGTVYLQGLRIWQRVLEPAANGPAPQPNSKPKTIAKNTLRSMLPVSRYVSYVLEPGTDFLLRAGGTAEVKAQDNGFTVTDDIVNILQQTS